MIDPGTIRIPTPATRRAQAERLLSKAQWCSKGSAEHRGLIAEATLLLEMSKTPPPPGTVETMRDQQRRRNATIEQQQEDERQARLHPDDYETIITSHGPVTRRKKDRKEDTHA